jgi:hypothetical protein
MGNRRLLEWFQRIPQDARGKEERLPHTSDERQHAEHKQLMEVSCCETAYPLRREDFTERNLFIIKALKDVE